MTTEVLVKDKSEETAVGSIGSLSWKERCFPGRTVSYYWSNKVRL